MTQAGISDWKEYFRSLKHYENMPLSSIVKLLQDSDSRIRSNAIEDLQFHGTEDVLDELLYICAYGDYKSREACAAVLGYMPIDNKKKLKTVLNALIDVSILDKSIRVRCSAIRGLGIRYCVSPSCRKAILPILADVSGAPQASIRFAATSALGYVNNKKVIPLIEKLLRDPDGHIREWTAFYLQQTGLDSVDIRNNLVIMLDDEYGEARYEAICALVTRKDKRVLPSLKNELQKQIVRLKMIEAAGDLGDPALLPELKSLVEDFTGDGDEGEQIAKKQYNRLKRKVQRQRRK